jgi:hypothetical protein
LNHTSKFSISVSEILFMLVNLARLGKLLIFFNSVKLS